MTFQPDNLINLRNTLGITRAEAARRLHMSAACYGRYEKGEREPSFQTVSFIAQVFGTTTDYLYGETDVITGDPTLSLIIDSCKNNPELTKRLYAYLKRISPT